MIIAKIQVTGVQANVLERVPVPAGIVGGRIEFVYDEAWEGLQKTVVITGAVTKDIVNAGDMVTVPAECVAKKMVRLHVGVYGMDDSGTLAIPTLWADLGIICDATDPSGDTSTDESFPVWAQILAAVGDLNQLSTQAKESLVAAVNEIAEKSGGAANPEDVRKIVEEYLKDNPPQVTETDPTVHEWAKEPEKPKYTAQEVGAVAKEELPDAINTALAQAKASGEFKGDPGEPGKDGYTPVKNVDYFDGKDGEPGADGKDYVLTSADKTEIAGMAAEMVDVPENSGFVVGDTAPMDTSLMWIDTSDNEESGGSGLMLAETLTLEQDVNTVTFTLPSPCNEVVINFVGRVNNADDSLSDGEASANIKPTRTIASGYISGNLAYIRKSGLNLRSVMRLSVIGENAVCAEIFKPVKNQANIASAAVFGVAEMPTPLNSVCIYMPTATNFFKAGSIFKVYWR